MTRKYVPLSIIAGPRSRLSVAAHLLEARVSNPAGAMDFCLLWVSGVAGTVLRDGPIPSPEGPTKCVCVCVNKRDKVQP